MILINMQNITLSFGGYPLLDHINLQIHSGEKLCLLGRNGEGKTSAMKLIQGIYHPDSGEIIREKNCTTSYLPQDVPGGISGTVYEVLAGGIALRDEMHIISAADEQKHRQSIEKTISRMSLDGDHPFESLSAGMKRRVLLGRALAVEPDILLLDEPTNHLDIESIKWTEDFLSRYSKTIFFVTHDRVFLQKIAERIIELDRGKIVDWKCDYSTFLKRKEAVLDAEEIQNANFDKKLAAEEAWIRRGVKARRTRNEGRVRALIDMRKEREARRERSVNAAMNINAAERSGKLVIEANDISFDYGTKNIIRDFSTTIFRGDKIGIIGPNGCGKSTLIRLLLGEIQPVKGNVRQGTKIEKAYFDQLREELNENLSVRENMSASGEKIEWNGKSRHVIGYLEDFLFTPDRASVKVKALSGGEKNRLMLAKLFSKPANFLILDEPTNDLDLETVELLEDLLVEFKGTLIVVSHDRAFLNNVVTGTLAFLGNGEVREFAGGYDDYLYQSKSGKISGSRKDKAGKKHGTVEKSAEKKLSFKEKNELESIPEMIEEKESRKKELYEKMSDPSFYREQASSAPEIIKEIELLDEYLHNLFLRWEELEAKEKY